MTSTTNAPTWDEITDRPIPPHYVKWGAPGIGPELSETDEVTTDLGDLLEQVRDEIRRSADSLEEEASIYADLHQYEDAWKCHVHADALMIQYANLDWRNRRHAPLYRSFTAGEMRSAIYSSILATAGLDLHPLDHGRLHVWEPTL